MLEGGQDPADCELVAEVERIFMRLTFLTTLAHLWKMAAMASATSGGDAAGRQRRWPPGWPRPQPIAAGCWRCCLRGYRYRIPAARGTQESLMEYDRRRSIKETLLEQIIAAAVETADAGRVIRLVMTRNPRRPTRRTPGSGPSRRCSARCSAATWPASASGGAI